jgi:hypothetical protein
MACTDPGRSGRERSGLRRARGFTLPLTIVLTFSVMSLATAVVGVVVVNDRAARSADRELTTLITLESGANGGLFALQRDGAPIANTWTDTALYNGRDVSLLFAPTRYKPDIDRDPAAVAGAVVADTDLRQRVLAALAPPSPDVRQANYARFRDFVLKAGAPPAEEDCLRQRLTLGRRAAKPEPRLPETALIPDRTPLVAGDAIDVRASLRDAHGGEEVLWLRMRYAGLPGQAWKTQDWRRLRLAPGALSCPPPPPP